MFVMMITVEEGLDGICDFLLSSLIPSSEDHRYPQPKQLQRQELQYNSSWVLAGRRMGARHLLLEGRSEKGELAFEVVSKKLLVAIDSVLLRFRKSCTSRKIDDPS